MGHARLLPELICPAGQIRAGDPAGVESCIVDEGLFFSLSEEFAVGDVGKLMATLGLIHVVGCYQYRHSLTGKLVDLIPELPSGFGVHAGGRLIQQQQLWLVEHACGECQALLPSARQGSGQLVGATGQADGFDGLLDRFPSVGDPVDACDEVEVFPDGEILVVAEALGHVADMLLDHAAFLEDVVSKAGSGTAVRLKKPAEHPDKGGFAAAVGAQKPENGSFGNAHIDVIDHGLFAEAFGHPFHVDDQWNGCGCRIHGERAGHPIRFAPVGGGV